MGCRLHGMRALAVLALLMGTAGPALADGIQSSIVDLGNMKVSSIARDGRVVGDVLDPNADYAADYSGGHPWGLGTRSMVYQDGKIRPLTEPGTGKYLQGAIISPGGTIAFRGTEYVGNDYFQTAHVIKDGQVYDAGTTAATQMLGGPGYSIAYAVNDAGVVAGESHAYNRWNRAYTSAPDPWYKTISYSYPTSMGANGGSVSNALGVNSQGTVVGWSDVATQWRNHAFVGTPSNDIGTLGGAYSEAYAINDKGQVVGWSHTDKSMSFDDKHAFLYDSTGMHDLGTLAGATDSMAVAINALGQAVGNSGGHAVLFQDGKVIDLNSFLPTDSGWILQTAIGINDIGQIVGSGTLDGQDHSYLLSLNGTILPAPEPSTWAIFTVAAMGLVGYRLRRK